MCQAQNVLPKYFMSSDGILGCGWELDMPSIKHCIHNPQASDTRRAGSKLGCITALHFANPYTGAILMKRLERTSQSFLEWWLWLILLKATATGHSRFVDETQVSR
jgi:hypothetical protein